MNTKKKRPYHFKNGSTVKRIKRMTAIEMRELAAGKTFEIEKTPPPPLRATQIEMRGILEKVARTAEAITVGQAFIIPSGIKNSAQGYLKRAQPKSTFRYSVIFDNPNMMRVYKTQ